MPGKITRTLWVAMLLGLISTPAMAEVLLQPGLRLVPAPEAVVPEVALTLDACEGKADSRIISTLIAEKIPATIFATARWLRRNPETVRLLMEHRDLFEIENHGARHLPAVELPIRIYGLKAAGSVAAVRAEIAGGEAAVTQATGRSAHWFRGATALYTAASLAEIKASHLEVAGYSIAADGGAAYSTARTEKEFRSAKTGDVLLAHVNHPEKPAGAGVVKGLLALKAKGYHFVRLDAAQTEQVPPRQVPLHTPAIAPPGIAAAPGPVAAAPLPPCPEVARAPALGPAPHGHPGARKRPAP